MAVNGDNATSEIAPLCPPHCQPDDLAKSIYKQPHQSTHMSHVHTCNIHACNMHCMHLWRMEAFSDCHGEDHFCQWFFLLVIRGPPHYLVLVVLDYELHSAHHKDSMYMMTPGSWNGPPSLPRRAACQPGDLAKSIHIIHSYQLFRFLNLSFLNRCMGQHPFV